MSEVEIKIKLLSFDKRGEVWLISRSGKEFLLIYTKAGMERGGETHHKIQTGSVLEGEMRLFTGTSPTSLVSRIYTPGTSFVIYPEAVHYMKAIQDTLHVESVTEYVDSCPSDSTRHNRHFISEIRDKLNV
jgi:quercetin dioxygenase-like cupin family protein